MPSPFYLRMDPTYNSPLLVVNASVSGVGTHSHIASSSTHMVDLRHCSGVVRCLYIGDVTVARCQGYPLVSIGWCQKQKLLTGHER
jgi:hypothetical protein